MLSVITLCLFVAFVLAATFVFEVYETSRRLAAVEASPTFGQTISDEEFLAACSPGVRPEVALKVRAIVSEQLDIPEHQIHPSHRFVEDLRAD